MIGLFPGKFLPPHRGHIASILQAHAMCSKLYVAVSERLFDDMALCAADGIPYISGESRRKWIMQETQGIDNLSIILLDEDPLKIPPWPAGWKQWAALVNKTVPEQFEVIFGGEPSYAKGSREHFPGIEYRLIDPNRQRWPISSTEIRKSPIKNWDYILGSARPFFCKKMLITGTESCGKTTLVKKLGKICNTSWSEEVGRHYSHDHLGGDEKAFTELDFLRIAHMQIENDFRAIRAANRICFIDTDAVVTNYYSKLYIGHECEKVNIYIDPLAYDSIVALRPDVEWIPDGLRFAGDEKIRWQLHEALMEKYAEHGFPKERIHQIGGDYAARLNTALSIVDELLG